MTNALPTLYVYPCGCIERDWRGSGRMERDCGDPACYRRTRNVTLGNRAQRRRRK